MWNADVLRAEVARMFQQPCLWEQFALWVPRDKSAVPLFLRVTFVKEQEQQCSAQRFGGRNGKQCNRPRAANSTLCKAHLAQELL